MVILHGEASGKNCRTHWICSVERDCKKEAWLAPFSPPGFYSSPAVCSPYSPTCRVLKEECVGQFQEQSKPVKVSRNPVTSHWYFWVKIKMKLSAVGVLSWNRISNETSLWSLLQHICWLRLAITI